jgi:hypothetical protein
MVLVLNFGLMVLDMKVSGEMTKLMVKENLYMQMVTYMKASGLMIRQKVKVHTVMLMEPIMRVHG